jgi:hypothetical protein
MTDSRAHRLKNFSQSLLFSALARLVDAGKLDPRLAVFACVFLAFTVNAEPRLSPAWPALPPRRDFGMAQDLHPVPVAGQRGSLRTSNA